MTSTHTPPPAEASENIPAASASKSGEALAIDRIIQLYGDLVFDFCESILWSPANAQLAFGAILKAIRRKRPDHEFQAFERAWILQIACSELLEQSSRLGRKPTSAEQIQLDSTPDLSSRLKRFDFYFHRLKTEDQMLLLLRDKYGLSYLEISSALQLPEGTIKLRRSQALRALEEWLWDQR